MPPKPMNVKASNDHDFVPPETYRPSRGPLPSELLAIKAISHFAPMVIEEMLGRPRLPNISDLEGIFRLFFTHQLVDLMVYHTN